MHAEKGLHDVNALNAIPDESRLAHGSLDYQNIARRDTRTFFFDKT